MIYDDSTEDNSYPNIREIFEGFIGLKLEDVSQHDKDDWTERGESWIDPLFEGGNVVRFPTGNLACIINPAGIGLDTAEPEG